jgi:hypothetical protein
MKGHLHQTNHVVTSIDSYPRTPRRTVLVPRYARMHQSGPSRGLRCMAPDSPRGVAAFGLRATLACADISPTVNVGAGVQASFDVTDPADGKKVEHSNLDSVRSTQHPGRSISPAPRPHQHVGRARVALCSPLKTPARLSHPTDTVRIEWTCARPVGDIFVSTLGASYRP